MKIKFFLIALFAFVIACKSDQNKLKSEIESLEQGMEATPNLDHAEVLADKYRKYFTAYPEDAEMNSKFQYRAAALQYRMNRFSGAIEILRQVLKEQHGGSNTFNNALFLADIYKEKMRNTESANTIYQALADAFPGHERIGEVKAKISAGLPPFEERLQNLSERMFNDSTGRLEYRIVNDFINSCELYAMIVPENEKCPEYLHKAGEMARSIRALNKALEIYEWISDKYPGHEKASQALFLRAFTLDNDLKRFDEAKVLYEEFLAKYPDDDFADDTQFLLDNLGKDDEEIINSFSGANSENE